MEVQTERIFNLCPPPPDYHFILVPSYQSIIYFNYVKIILHICFWLDKTLL